jgi:Calx-beta domain
MTRILLSLLFCLLCVSSVSALELTVNKPSANEEGSSTAEFIFTRSTGDALTAEITINFEIVKATTVKNATENLDYTLSGNAYTLTGLIGSLKLPANSISTKLIVTPNDDTSAEGGETVTITIKPGTNYVITGNQAQSITIHDNDIVASITSPIPTAYEDYTTKISPVNDPDRIYRGVFEVSLTPSGLATYITTTLTAGGSIGKATLNTDYKVFYKIGGSEMGYGMGYKIVGTHAYDIGTTTIKINSGGISIPEGSSITFGTNTDSYTTTADYVGGTGSITLSEGLKNGLVNEAALTITPPTAPSGFKVNQPTAPVAGAQSVIVSGGDKVISQGAKISFGTAPRKYSVTARLNGGNGVLAFTPGLEANVADATAITVSYDVPTGYKVNQPNELVIKGTTKFSVKNGIGGFKVGDVFQIGTDTATRYVVNTAFTVTDYESVTDGEIQFEAFAGPAENKGLPKTIPADTTILTYFPAQFSPSPNDLEMQIYIPETANKVQYGIVPVSDTAIEGAENLFLTLLNSADYKLADKTVTNMTITDDEIIASFDSKPTNATAGGAPGSFTVNFIGGVFPRDMEVNYAITQNLTDKTIAMNGGAKTDIEPPLSGKLIIKANQSSGVITVNAKADAVGDPDKFDGEKLNLTLLANDSYRLAPTTGTPPNASASITINDSLGTVSIAAKQTSISESPNEKEEECFTVSVETKSSQDIIVPIQLDSASTATDAGDFKNLPSSVTIKANETSAVVKLTTVFDTLPEPTEKIKVKILGGFGYIVKDGASTAEISLTDDEPVFSVVKKSGLTNITEGKSEALFTIAYEGSLPSGGLTVPFTLGGKATSSDYTAPNPSSLTFTSSEGKSKDLIIPIIDDNTAEGNEDLTLTLTAGPTEYFLVDDKKTASVTIEDNLVTLSLAVTNATEGATGKFTITSNVIPSKPLTLTYKVLTSSTATPRNTSETTGGDYEKLSGTVEIKELSTDILVKTFTDREFEPKETVDIEFTLSDPPTFKTSGANFSKATVTIFDERPTVISVSSTKSDGTYVAKSVIPIHVEFSDNVTVTGNPQLMLETGSKDAVATFTNVSGKIVNFTYTVDYNHETNNLEYNSTAALSLNGGTIKKLSSTADAYLLLPSPNSEGSLGYKRARIIAGGSDDGKPNPGDITQESSGGCGLGSGFAALATLLLLLGIRLRDIRKV